ncbi:MAG TPA: tetratricopeptide repeat protein [Planctomycetota bacterium]|nr:tetratricopeptide repeat protein [Planctomycetota bacterium]
MSRWAPLLLLGACASVPVAPLTPREAPAARLVDQGDLLRRRGRPEEAEARYREALAADGGSVRARLGLQEIGLSDGRALALRREAREHGDAFLAGRLEPPRRQAEVYELAEEPWRSLGLAMASRGHGDSVEAYDRVRSLDPGLAMGRIGLANALLSEGRMGEAEAEYLAARWADPDHPAPSIGLSVIADQRGDLEGALRYAAEAYRLAPGEEALADRVQEIAGRAGKRAVSDLSRLFEAEGAAGDGWALLLASRMAANDGDPARARALVEKAQARGMTDAEVAAAPAPVPPPIRPFVDAFVRGTTARYRHYAATGERESFREFHAWARRLYEQTTGRKLGPPGKPIDYSFVGTLMDPTAASDEPLVSELAAQGLLLVLGQRTGGPPEAMLSELVRREPKAKVRVRGTEVEREVAWTGTRHLAGYQEWRGGGDLAGLALEGLVLVDLHAIARWEGEIERRRARLEPRREEILGEAALEDPPVSAIDDPAGVEDRLYLEAKPDLRAEVVAHEDAHLVDAQMHLPVLKHPLRNLELAFRSGFSAEEILSALERNAQLTAIAEGPSPRAALATCCAALGRGDAHGIGYTAIVEAFVEEIHDRPEQYPEIDASRVIVQQLHRLPDGKIRALARNAMERWNLNVR